VASESLSNSAKFGVSLNLPVGQLPIVGLADTNGNTIHSSDMGDGTSFLGGSITLMALPTADYTTSIPDAATFLTGGVTYMALDIALNSFTGGASPSINFFYDRQDANGLWFNIWTSGNVGTPTNYSIDLGAGFGSYSYPTNLYQHAVFTHRGRFRWTLGGGTPPTSANFSASAIGRSP
jgi:hypothetical protein